MSVPITDGKFQEILAAPDKFTLCWFEPWPGFTRGSDPVDVGVELRATAAGCINLQLRATPAHYYHDIGTDGDLLSSFIAVHWASLVEEPA